MSAKDAGDERAVTNLDYRGCVRLANAILLRAVWDLRLKRYREHAAWFLTTEWAADLAEIVGLGRDKPRKILARLKQTRPCLMRPGRPQNFEGGHGNVARR